MASMIEILNKKKSNYYSWTEQNQKQLKVKFYAKDRKQYYINNISDPKNESRVPQRVVFLSGRHKSH